jgi:hypothetical protein
MTVEMLCTVPILAMSFFFEARNLGKLTLEKGRLNITLVLGLRQEPLKNIRVVMMFAAVVVCVWCAIIQMIDCCCVVLLLLLLFCKKRSK